MTLQRKSIQVERLRDIFLAASGILTWLGECCSHDHSQGPHLHEGIRFLNQLGREVEEALDNADGSDEISSRMERVQALLKQRIDADTIPFHSLCEIFENSIWTRAWCLQELAVPVDKPVMLMLGTHCLEWPHMIIAYSVLRQMAISAIPEPPPPEWPRFCTALNRLTIATFAALDNNTAFFALEDAENVPPRHLSIRDYLESVRGLFKVADPRDMVYCLLSLAKDTTRLGIRPDYSLSCAEVYRRVAAAIFPEHDHRILYKAQRAQQNVLGLPSFVPDWTSPPLRSISKESTTFRAAGDTHTNLYVDPSYTTMTIKGNIVDSVWLYGQPWEGMERVDISKARSWYNEFEGLVRTFSALDPSRHRVYEGRDTEFAIISSAIARNMSADSVPEYLESFVIFRGLVPTEGLSEQILDGSISPYVQRLNIVAESRRGFVTSQGYVGLGPCGIERGDLVCILFGVDVPFILRRGEHGRYSLVGDAYVCGIMHGEFMAQPCSDQVFELV